MVQKNLPPSINSMKCQNRRYFSISADNALSSPFARFSCILSHVFSLLPPVSRLLTLCFPSSASCLSSLVSRLAVSCLTLTSPMLTVSAADLAILWSKLADLGNLAILADWKQKFLATWSLADLEFNVSPFSWAKFELGNSAFHLLNFQFAVANNVSILCK